MSSNTNKYFDALQGRIMSEFEDLFYQLTVLQWPCIFLRVKSLVCEVFMKIALKTFLPQLGPFLLSKIATLGLDYRSQGAQYSFCKMNTIT